MNYFVIGVWFSGSDSTSSAPSGGASSESSHGVSPRPLKKLSFKTGAKKNMRADSMPVTPPDSPTNRKYR